MKDCEKIIKQLNEKKFYKLEEISCGDVLFTTVTYTKASCFLMEIARFLKELFICRVKAIRQGKGKAEMAFLFSSSYEGRLDHRFIYDNVSNLFSDRIEYLPDRKVCLQNLKYIFLYFIWFFQLYKNFSLNESAEYARVLHQSYVTALKVKQSVLNNDIRKVVVLCDTHAIDCMTVQLLNIEGIITITMQHGHYIYNSPGFRYSDSKYFLCYGRGEYDNVVDVKKENKYLLVGMPQLIGKIKRSQVIRNNYKSFVIAMSGYINDEIDVLKITEEMVKRNGYKRIIKLHPKQSEYDYDYQWLEGDLIIKDEKNIIQLMEYNDFAIIPSGSTCFIEYIVELFPVFIYKDSRNSYQKTEWCKFTSYEGLSNLVELYNNGNTDLFDKMLIETRSYYTEIDDIELKYKTAILSAE